MAEVVELRNNVCEYPIYGLPWGVVFPILDADGDLVTGAAGLDSEVSKNGDTFTDCTNEATEIATSSGMYYLLLTPSEMGARVVTVIVKTSTTGAKTTPMVLYTKPAPILVGGIVQGTGLGNSVTLESSASPVDGAYVGCVLYISVDGVDNLRTITGYVGSTRVATPSQAWSATPDTDDTYSVYLTDTVQTPQADAIAVSHDMVAADTLELFAEALDQSTGQIDNGTFAAGAIDAAAIAANAIGSSEIAAGAITSGKFAAGAIDATAIANGAIDAATFAAGAIDAAAVANGALDAATFAVDYYAAINAEVADVVVTDVLADSVPADGSRPSLAQAAYMIAQFLNERTVVGTTVTVKKVDGSTTLMTFTLNDATTPTSITRTT